MRPILGVYLTVRGNACDRQEIVDSVIELITSAADSKIQVVIVDVYDAVMQMVVIPNMVIELGVLNLVSKIGMLHEILIFVLYIHY
jgi:hypothetical protein